tara:strand:- start:1930 stop:2160 length:231 start_codon:yes stop_codon:yes gene_type:complete
MIHMTGNDDTIERIKKRPLPEFNDTDSGLIEGILEDGFLNVALNDSNQFGPHAMIILLGIVASVTGLILLIAMKLF